MGYREPWNHDKAAETPAFANLNVVGVEGRVIKGTRKSYGSVQFSSVAQSCPTLCNLMDCSTQASLLINNSRSLPKLIPIKLVMPPNHLILCRPLRLLPPIPPSIRIFSNESTLCMRWPKYWNYSFSIIPSKEHPGLISFRMDWLDLLAVQVRFL